MPTFLVIYDRAAGTLVRSEAFADHHSAMRARFDAEVEFRGRDEVEIVALSATSEDALRRTHGRYFLGLDELAERMTQLSS